MSTPPDAAETALALVHRGWDHLRLQRPLAAWASWQRALRLRPGDAAATEALRLLDETHDLPAAARQPRRFRNPADDAGRARWDAAFRGRDLQDLDVAALAFEQLSESDAHDAAARFNLGLCRAWQGRNDEAIAALDGFVRLAAVADFGAAVDAWALAEVLRHGGGAEPLADDLAAALDVPWPADRDVAELDGPGTLRPHPAGIDPATGAAADPDAVPYEWLDRPMPDAADVRSAGDLPRLLATVVRRPGSLHLSTPDPIGREELQARLIRALRLDPRTLDWSFTPLPLRFLDAALWTFRLPLGLDDEARARLTREAVERSYEDEWIHVPRLGLASDQDDWRDADELRDTPARLGGDRRARTPLDAGRRAAAGDAVARAKLEGVLRFRAQLAARPRLAPLIGSYPFDRLRRRVGIVPHEPAMVDNDDLSCAGLDELAALDASRLPTPVLAEAFRSASHLDDSLAARLAAVLVGRDPSALAREDSIDPLAALTWDALARGAPGEALDWLDRAEQAGRPAADLAHDREFFGRAAADPDFAARWAAGARRTDPDDLTETTP